jgi:ABC-type antimicrobial peptide transport system permease subunit
MVEMIKYAVDLVTRRKLRTFLTSLGILIAVMLMSFILFGMSDLETLIINQFTSQFKPNELTVSTRDYFGMAGGAFSAPSKEDVKNEDEEVVIDQNVLETIKEYDGVEKVYPMVMINGFDIYLEGDDIAYPMGFPRAVDIPGDHSMYGGLIAGDDLELDDNEVYVSTFVSEFYELSNEEIIGKNIILRSSSPTAFSTPTRASLDKEYQFTVVGVVDSMNEVLFMGLDKGLEIVAEIGDYEDLDEYISVVGFTDLLLETDIDKTGDVEEYIINDLNLSVISSETLLEFISTITGGLTIALILFGSISAVVASIGIVNTMIMSIYEQTKEIGIIKAIGASNWQVLIIFLIQSALIGLFGGLMGLGITFGLMKLADPFIVDLLIEQGFEVTNFFNFRFDYAMYIALASIMVGILAGLYPAYKASKLDPVKALRYE